MPHIARQYPHHFEHLNSPHSILFITVCTHNRKSLLANDSSWKCLVNLWSGSRNWVVGRYCILPDHLHLFVQPRGNSSEPLKFWIHYWKWAFSKNLKELEKPIWQSDFWDTKIRRSDSYSSKWDYVRNNPVRHGYVTRAEEWRYQGEIYPLSQN
ncbi:MAG: hypothetical protein V4507_05780 [Verrucomicrobiota bacterium]